MTPRPEDLWSPWLKTAANSSWYHLTDNPDFALDPEYNPVNNTTLGGDWPNKGLFVAQDPGNWYHGYDYVRPFVAELEGEAQDQQGYGREHFIPAEQFPNTQVKRVIPYNAWEAERYDNQPYTGPDVRQMSPEERAQHFDATNQYIRDARAHMLSYPCENCGENATYNQCEYCDKVADPTLDKYQQRGYMPQFKGTGDFYTQHKQGGLMGWSDPKGECPICGEGQVVEDVDPSTGKMIRECVNCANHWDPYVVPDSPHPDPWMDNEPGSLTLPEHWGKTAAGYYSPGNYQRFLDEFRRMQIEELLNEQQRLQNPPGQAGCAWPNANYYRALQQAITEKTSQPGMKAPSTHPAMQKWYDQGLDEAEQSVLPQGLASASQARDSNLGHIYTRPFEPGTTREAQDQSRAWTTAAQIYCHGPITPDDSAESESHTQSSFDAGQRVWTPDGQLARVDRFYTTLPGTQRAVVRPLDATHPNNEQHHDVSELTPETETGYGEAFGDRIQGLHELSPGDLLYAGSGSYQGEPNVLRVHEIKNGQPPSGAQGFTWQFVNPAEPMSPRLPTDQVHFTWDHEIPTKNYRRADDLAGGVPDMLPPMQGSLSTALVHPAITLAQPVVPPPHKAFLTRMRHGNALDTNANQPDTQVNSPASPHLLTWQPQDGPGRGIVETNGRIHTWPEDWGTHGAWARSNDLEPGWAPFYLTHDRATGSTYASGTAMQHVPMAMHITNTLGLPTQPVRFSATQRWDHTPFGHYMVHLRDRQSGRFTPRGKELAKASQVGCQCGRAARSPYCSFCDRGGQLGPSVGTQGSSLYGTDWQEPSRLGYSDPDKDFEDEQRKWATGGCGVLAHHIHQQTGWPIMGWAGPDEHAQRASNPEWASFPHYDHVFIRHPSGQALDARGLHPMPEGAEQVDPKHLQALFGAEAFRGWPADPDQGVKAHPDYSEGPEVARQLIGQLGTQDLNREGSHILGSHTAGPMPMNLKMAGPATAPPNYREAGKDGSCAGCKMFDKGKCWGYGNTEVEPEMVCDSFDPETRDQYKQAAGPLSDGTTSPDGTGQRVLYHHTWEEAAPQIEQEGLKPDPDQAGGVYLTTNPKTHPSEGNVSYEVNVDGLPIEPDATTPGYEANFPGEQWYVHYDTIRPERLRRIAGSFSDGTDPRLGMACPHCGSDMISQYDHNPDNPSFACDNCDQVFSPSESNLSVPRGWQAMSAAEACPECGATDEYQGGLCYSCGYGSKPCPRCGNETDDDGYCWNCKMTVPPEVSAPGKPQCRNCGSTDLSQSTYRGQAMYQCRDCAGYTMIPGEGLNVERDVKVPIYSPMFDYGQPRQGAVPRTLTCPSCHNVFQYDRTQHESQVDCPFCQHRVLDSWICPTPGCHMDNFSDAVSCGNCLTPNPLNQDTVPTSMQDPLEEQFRMPSGLRWDDKRNSAAESDGQEARP